jgi:hypothetical protein
MAKVSAQACPAWPASCTATIESSTAGTHSTQRAVNTCCAICQRRGASAVTASRVAAARKPPSTIIDSRLAHTSTKLRRPNSCAPMREAISGSTSKGSSKPHRRRGVHRRQRVQQPRRRCRHEPVCFTTSRAV